MSILRSWWSGSSQTENTEEALPTQTERDTDEVKKDTPASSGDDVPTSSGGDVPTSSGGKGLPVGGDVSDVSSWVKGFGELVSTVGGYANTIRDTVSTTVQSNAILNEFEEEQKKFERERQRQRDTAVPPWVGFNEEEQIKAQIMELSSDSRNVLRNPPPGIQFHFEFAKSYPVALALLKEDERLQKLRFELVPKKIKEERFWHNYFYRVFLIKQSSQLSSLASAEHHSTSSPVHNNDGDESPAGINISTTTSSSTSAPSFPHEDTDHVAQDNSADDFASDALVMMPHCKEQPISLESVRAELDQLGVEEEKKEVDVLDSEEWDEELLAKELEDLGIDGMEEGGGGVQDEQWENDLKVMLETHSTDHL